MPHIRQTPRIESAFSAGRSPARPYRLSKSGTENRCRLSGNRADLASCLLSRSRLKPGVPDLYGRHRHAPGHAAVEADAQANEACQFDEVRVEGAEHSQEQNDLREIVSEQK